MFYLVLSVILSFIAGIVLSRWILCRGRKEEGEEEGKGASTERQDEDCEAGQQISVISKDYQRLASLPCERCGRIQDPLPLERSPSQNKSIETVLFFPDEKLPCETFYRSLENNKEPVVCRNLSQCKFLHRKDPPSSLMKIFLALNGAKKKVDLCMYILTHKQIANFLIHLHKVRKVRIRIITNSSDDEVVNLNNQAVKLQQSGIEVRTATQNKGPLIQDKFVIIDGKLLLQGSFNWTKNAVRRSDECVFVHTNRWVVSKLSSKFEKMWAQRAQIRVEQI